MKLLRQALSLGCLSGEYIMVARWYIFKPKIPI
jgi:hypothetical protein